MEMVRFSIWSSIVFLLIGCVNVKPSSSKIAKIINVDYYLADKNIPQLAKDLYLGKLKPTDDLRNLALMDSLETMSRDSAFYFLVMTKAMRFSDGAYGEALGRTAKKYIEGHSVSFFSYFKNNENLLTSQDFANWARCVYSEINISSEGYEQRAVEDFRTQLLTNCKNRTVQYSDWINRFVGLLQ